MAQRPSWMLDNERLSDLSVHFSVNGLALPAICPYPLDLIKLTDKLTKGCVIAMPDMTKWPRKLTLQLNAMDFPQTYATRPSLARDVDRKLAFDFQPPLT